MRAFSRRMPAFGEALTDGRDRADHRARPRVLRRPAWPRGELNLPRALVTEKAYPENEALLTDVDSDRAPRASSPTRFVYERRFGARSQFEVAVPLDDAGERGQAVAARPGRRGGGRQARALPQPARGSIVSVGGEVVLPTGKESEGLGGGDDDIRAVRVRRPDACAATRFLQAQAGAELPRLRERREREAFWRGVVGTTFVQGGFGRSWSPMLELAARARARGRQPVAVGRRAADAGIAQQAAAHPDQRRASAFRSASATSGTRRCSTYLLWDWFDGGLRDGWR